MPLAGLRLKGALERVDPQYIHWRGFQSIHLRAGLNSKYSFERVSLLKAGEIHSTGIHLREFPSIHLRDGLKSQYTFERVEQYSFDSWISQDSFERVSVVFL